MEKVTAVPIKYLIFLICDFKCGIYYINTKLLFCFLNHLPADSDPSLKRSIYNFLSGRSVSAVVDGTKLISSGVSRGSVLSFTVSNVQ